GLAYPDIIEEIESRGLSITEVMAMPELDAWRSRYTDPETYHASEYVCHLLQAAGSLPSTVNCPEFTNRDLYELDIFTGSLPSVCPEGSLYCHVSGDYALTVDK
ncbi:hypothetical protein KIPB_014677, partial [Kipferlia bialata]